MPNASGLVPDISLGVGNQNQNSMGNALGGMSEIMRMQLMANQNQMFQQQLKAKSLIGQYIAQYGLEDGLAKAVQDPNAAAYVPESMNSLRQMQQTTLQMQGEKMNQGISGMNAALRSTLSALSDPNMFEPSLNRGMATLSPAAAATDTEPLNDFRKSLGSMAKSDPERFKSTLSGILIASGVTPEAIQGVIGTPAIMDIGPGGVPTPGVRQPTAMGGGFIPAGTTASPGPVLLGGPIGNGSAIGPSLTEKAFATKTGEAGGDIANEMVDNGKALPTALKRMDIMANSLSSFQAGGGANIRESTAKALQAFKNAGVSGITDDMINKVGNSDLAATQAFTAQVKPLVISELKQAAQGTGRVMRSEVDAFMQMMNETTDPRALVTLLNQAKYSLQVGYDQSQKFIDFKQALARKDPSVAGLDPSDFYGWYNKSFNTSTLPGQNPGGGFQMGATPLSAVKGALEIGKETTINGVKVKRIQ